MSKVSPHIYKEASEGHKAACRALLYALGLMESDGWMAWKQIIAGRLSERERACIALAALRSMNLEDRQKVLEVAFELDEGAGVPMPTFGEVHDDAQWWASIANQQEHEAYLMAAYKALSKKSQQELQAHLKGEW